MIPALLAAFLAAECLAASPVKLAALEPAIPQDLRASFVLPAEAESRLAPGLPMGAALGPIIRVQAPAPPRASQVVKVDLPALFNRHLRTVEIFSRGQDTFTLGTQVDLKGDAYLAVQGQDWTEPYFFKIKSDMQARWRSTSGTVYLASIDGSIFRRKFNNKLVIRDEAADQLVYSRRLTDFFGSAAVRGETVAIGGKTYRVFFSYLVEDSRNPIVFDRSAYGLCLLYDESDDPGYHDFKNYPIAFSAVQGPAPAAFRLQDGQVLYFRLADEGRTLVVSD